jgi:hypothetical protein
MEFDRRRRDAEESERSAAAQMKLTEASASALKEAMLSTRNDEESQYYRQENERLQAIVVKQSGIIANLRNETRGYGTGKASYFIALGKDIQNAARDMENAGDRMVDRIVGGGIDTEYLRTVALMLQERGSALGEFGENALAYGEDAKLNKR